MNVRPGPVSTNGETPWHKNKLMIFGVVKRYSRAPTSNIFTISHVKIPQSSIPSQVTGTRLPDMMAIIVSMYVSMVVLLKISGAGRRFASPVLGKTNQKQEHFKSFDFFSEAAGERFKNQELRQLCRNDGNAAAKTRQSIY